MHKINGKWCENYGIEILDSSSYKEMFSDGTEWAHKTYALRMSENDCMGRFPREDELNSVFRKIEESVVFSSTMVKSRGEHMSFIQREMVEDCMPLVIPEGKKVIFISRRPWSIRREIECECGKEYGDMYCSSRFSVAIVDKDAQRLDID